ncbi:hypothetical protein Bca52824_006469 [Brassica carinata]|uniref:Uncharacterized protein n=1 Tax=Brassica carinata TaxID=52824 RepID=A0A8X7W621_BRACI|nr:hypothetical protein Bca52824_006469 [Brassica carinata]
MVITMIPAKRHTDLNLVDILEAEHNPELIVQPMMEVPADVPVGWGIWDDEIDDRRVTYMVGLIDSAQKYNKTS